MGVSVLKTCNLNNSTGLEPSARWRQPSPVPTSPEGEQQDDIFHFNNNDQPMSPNQHDEKSRSDSTEQADTRSSPPAQDNKRSSSISEEVAPGANLFPITAGDLSEVTMSSTPSPGFYPEDAFRPAKGANGSAGKTKVQKCRSCDFTTTNKVDIWKHLETHLRPEKIIRCPACPFITEYKHHMDFHLQNHGGIKPFQCDKCTYSCVNKSMLKSHLKSHSNVYQFNCADCAYRTKYCHSLKIHLRKYKHVPGIVLDADGTPNPNPVIDVYGNRRGPRQKSKKNAEATSKAAVSLAVQTPNPNPPSMPLQPSKLSTLTQLSTWVLPNPTFGPHFMPNVNALMPLPFNLCAPKSPETEEDRINRIIASKSPNNNNNVNVNNLNCSGPVVGEQSGELTSRSPFANTNSNNDSMTFERMKMQDLSPSENSLEGRPLSGSSSWIPEVEMVPEEAPLNLCVANIRALHLAPGKSTVKSRRKGAARRLHRSFVERRVEDVPEKPLSPVKPEPSIKVEDENYDDGLPKKFHCDKSYYCQFCEIHFFNEAMYNIHVGYHGFSDPFTCNRCGMKTEDKVGFYMHMVSTAHPSRNIPSPMNE